MHKDEWLAEIAMQMQKAAFSPRRIERMTLELSQHYQDLMEENAMQGMSHTQIVERMGTPSHIVEAAKAEKRNRSPWLYFGLIPLFATLGCWIAIQASIVAAGSLLESMGYSLRVIEDYAVARMAVSCLWIGAPIGAAFLASCLQFRIFSSRDQGSTWAVIAFLLIAMVAAPLQNHLNWENHMASSGFQVSLDGSLFQGFRSLQCLMPLAMLALCLVHRHRSIDLAAK